MVSVYDFVYKYQWIGRILFDIATSFQYRLLTFYGYSDIAKLIKKIKKEVSFGFLPLEAFTLYSVVKSQSKLPGDMAEVGVYQGGSAKIICEAKGNKKLYLFDTFEGLKDVSKTDTHFGIKLWKEKDFSDTDLKTVEKFLQEYDNVYLFKGKFPENSEHIKNFSFSFVHIDVDLYQSTTNCLEFFYPLLTRGGTILIHDFHSDGIKSAFNDFIQDKNDYTAITINGSQCLVVKL